MVGLLPGPAVRSGKVFIGLSENVADQNGVYVFDRNEAT